MTSLTLGGLTVVALTNLVLCYVEPRGWMGRAHDWLGALSLGLVALAYLVYQAGRSASQGEWAKAGLVAVAFLAWAANQVWPDHGQAVLLNDVAIVAFVVDVLLTIAGWPSATNLEATEPAAADDARADPRTCA